MTSTDFHAATTTQGDDVALRGAVIPVLNRLTVQASLCSQAEHAALAALISSLRALVTVH